MEQSSAGGFRTCPACGSLTPADSPDCAHCGARSVESLVAEHEEARLRAFARALFTRSNPYTYLFIAINLGVFALMWLAGGQSVLLASDDVLLGFGAKQNTLIDQGQYWRLVTSIFIHIGFLHFFFNNYALWIIGREVERLYGSARFVILYLTTGVAGSLASYQFSPQAMSAGASGAIFGLFGVLATFAYRYRRELPDLIRRDITRRIMPVIGLNLLITFAVPIIDKGAHLAGLLVGVGLALVIPYKRPGEKLTAMVWRMLQAVCLIVIAGSFYAAYRNYGGPALELANLTQAPGRKVQAYVEHMDRGQRAFAKGSQAFSRVLNSRRREAGTALKEVEGGLDALRDTPQVDGQSNLYRRRLTDLLVEQKRLIEQFSKSEDRNYPEAIAAQNALIEDYQRFMREYRPWLEEFLKQHGYVLKEVPQDGGPGG